MKQCTNQETVAKNKLSAKDFIKMKRLQAKEATANIDILQKLRALIASANHKEFGILISKSKPELVINFLFIEDERSSTPLIRIISQKLYDKFLPQINNWSCSNSRVVDSCLQNGQDELKVRDWRAKYRSLNKSIAQIINQMLSQKADLRLLITLLGQQEGIFYKLAKKCMTIDEIILFMSSFKTSHDILKEMYLNLLLDTPLTKQKQQLLKQVQSYHVLLVRQKIWKSNDYLTIIKSLSKQNLQMLKLSQLDYNFWHQLALTDQNQFLNILDIIYQMQQNDELSAEVTEMLMEFDRGCQSPIDKCLRIWPYQSLYKLLTLKFNINNLMLTTNSLNKILANHRLTQKQKQNLIVECLQGKISKKGFLKMMPIIQIYKCKRITSIKQLQLRSLSNTFSICYQKNAVKKQKDSADCYPLVTYLKMYKQKASLKIIQLLFLQNLDSRKVKKHSLCIMMQLKEGSMRYNRQSDWYKQIQFLYDYYQSLWKTICALKHGEVLQYLITKIFTNTYQIKMFGKGQTTEFKFVCDHFIRFYFQNNPFLGQDQINKHIIANILECKNDQKKIHEHQLYLQLIKSLNNLEIFHKSNDYIVVAFRKRLKSFIDQISEVNFIKPLTIWNHTPLIQIIAEPLAKNLPSILSIQQFISKFKKENLIELIKLNEYKEITISGRLYWLIKTILKKINLISKESQEENTDQFWKLYGSKKYVVIQQKYFRTNRNLDFFQKFKQYILNKIDELNQVLFNSSQFGYGYFRLSHRQLCLPQKIQSLIGFGIDPYFSRYTKETITDKSITGIWEKLLNRMIKQNISFLGALKTEPGDNFQHFERVFVKALSDKSAFIWRLLVYRILEIDEAILQKKNRYNIYKHYTGCVKRTKTIINLSLIIDLIKLINKHQEGIKINNVLDVVFRFFKRNIHNFFRELIQLQIKIKRGQDKQKQTNNLKYKQAQLQNYFKQWVPQLLTLQQMHTKQFIICNFFIPLINEAKNRKVVDYCRELVKIVSLQSIFSNDLCFTKMRLMDNPGEEYLKILISLDKQNFLQWFRFFRQSRYSNMNGEYFFKIFSGFTFGCQLKIINEIIGRLIKQDIKYVANQSRLYKFKNKQRLLILQVLSILYRPISQQRKIEAFLALKNIKEISYAVKHSVKNLLFQTKTINLTTAGLILIDHSEQFDFYLINKQSKLIKYDTVNFYPKSSIPQFEIYLNNLNALHQHSFNQHLHIQKVINALIQAQQWVKLQKIISIKSLEVHLVQTIFINFYHSSNRKSKLQSPDFRKIVDSMFQIMQKNNIKPSEQLFAAAFYADSQKSIRLIPKVLAINTIYECIKQSPQISSQFLKVGVCVNLENFEQISKSKHFDNGRNYNRRVSISYWFPMIQHKSWDRENRKWMIDELRFQCSIFKQLQQHKNTFYYYVQSMKSKIELLPFRKQFYEQEEYLGNICKWILNDPENKSFKPFTKQIPMLKQRMQKYLLSKDEISTKKGKCINLQAINKTILCQLITDGYLTSSQQKSQYSFFVRVIDRGDFDIINLFMSKNNLKMSLPYLKGLEQYYTFSFLSHLFSICNEPFLINFIKMYNIFEMFSIQQFSPLLLMTVCTYRFNKLLEHTIKWVSSKFNTQPIFIAQLFQNNPEITQKGLFYLPVQRSIEFNFYECFFLIKKSGNESPKFTLSHRFLSKVESSQWNYLPQFKRRVQINNGLMETIRQCQQKQFRQNVVLPNIFQLEGSGQHFYERVSYKGSLCRFVCDLSQGQTNFYKDDQESVGIFQKLCLLIYSKDKTGIPVSQLQKMYPSQMKIINKLEQFLPKSAVETDLGKIFKYCPQFKAHLLLHRPRQFLQDVNNVQQLLGRASNTLDYSSYLRAIQVNFQLMQSQYRLILEIYIKNCFFNQKSTIQDVKSSAYLKRYAFQLILFDVSEHNRQFQSCFIFQKIKEQGYWQNYTAQRFIYEIARHLNNRGDNQMSFDLMMWNKIIEQINQTAQYWHSLQKEDLNQYVIDEFQKTKLIGAYNILDPQRFPLFNLVNASEIFSTVLDNQTNHINQKAVFIELSLLMNACLLEFQLTQFKQRLHQIKGSSKIAKFNIKFVSKVNKSITLLNETEITLQVVYVLSKHQSQKVTLLQINFNQISEQLRYQLYFVELQQQTKLKPLNDYCSQVERHIFFRGYEFVTDIKSFKNVKDFTILQNILQYDQNNIKTDGAIYKIKNQIQKMEEKLAGSRSMKLYSSSDIYGPINFAEQVNNDKIIECLCFYELISLPKDSPIVISYVSQPEMSKQTNRRILNHIKLYLNYYISSSKQEGSQKVEIDNVIEVYLREVKNKEMRIELNWSFFGGWSVCELVCLVLNYCSDISTKIQQILDVRLSYLSLIRYYEQYMDIEGTLGIKQTIGKMLTQNQMSLLIETILLMITQDVRNIMKIVKGIIIQFSINDSTKPKKANVIVSQFVSATSVQYQVREQLLHVIINLQMKKNLNKKDTKADQPLLLVSRKQFLDCIFVSAQFLTDYFLEKQQLNSECVKISTSLTGKLNSTINFHIQFSNLYKFIDEMRKQSSIKDIKLFLNRLKHYLITAMDRSINVYLSSNELANLQQIILLNKCEAINKAISLQKVNSIKQLVYYSQQLERPNGLSEIEGLMNEVDKSQLLKNAFLIQIYKSSYSTIVAEGMTFVVGFKSSKKKAQVIAITKAENINEINVIEVDYLLLVSRNIPSNDQLNHNKIIRIFVTDYNKIVYKVNDKLKQYFLGLPEDSQDTRIADFAPIISSNIKLQFYTSKMKHQADSKDTKLFFVDLSSENKLKMLPEPDLPVTPINILKRSTEFKEATKRLQQRMRQFFKENICIIVDPPSVGCLQANINYAHLFQLISIDVIELINKFQYQPMRNQSIDCKLSTEKGLALNQNGVIQLRKRCFASSFQHIRVRIREERSEVVTYAQNQIIINISLSNVSSLPSSLDYLSSILEQLIKLQKNQLPKQVTVNSQIKHESTERLLKLLDILILLNMQIQEIASARQVISIAYNTNFQTYRIIIDRKKADITFDKHLTLSFNFEMPDREFYSSQYIVSAYVRFKNPNVEVSHENILSYYCPIRKAIFVQSTAKDKFKLAYTDTNDQWNVVKTVGYIAGNELRIELPQKLKVCRKFILLEESCHFITSNYFYELKDSSNTVSTKNAQALIGRQNYLYLKSNKQINLNFSQIAILSRDPIQRQKTTNNNLLHPKLRKIISVALASKNVYLLSVNSGQSAILTVQYGGNSNLLNLDIESSTLTVSSDGEMNLANTKFVELQNQKKKPIAIKQKQNDSTNLQFRQPSEIATKEFIQIKQKDKNNLQNLVYVVNQQCKRFLTRAGQQRVDSIMLCDSDDNPLYYEAEIEVFFLHSNRLAMIRPKIQRKGMQIGLRWAPTVRGHYYMYVNQVRMNPTYEIGVCASYADHLISKVTAPKVTNICYCEETEIMLDLRDSFGNIYSQLQQQIIGDELLIDIESDYLQGFLKMQKSQINKYGLKKVKFHFNNTENDAPADLNVAIFLNRQKICQFLLKIQGYSLQQRKKLLDNQIYQKDKRYQKDITVNRNRFLEDLFTVAEMSLNTTFKVKFAGEPGIDAGGVKREFYDLVGNEMKSENNPFFRLVNKSKLQYFLNPDLLRNKKRLQYMELWGKYLANSFLNGYLVGVSFSPVFVKLLYGQQVYFEDLLDVLSEEEKRQYMYLLTASPDDFEDLDLYFTVMVDRKKCIQVQLKPLGKQIAVTAANVKSYLELTAKALLSNRYKQLIDSFRKGFQTVLQLGMFIKWLRPTEFWCMTAGNKQITPELVLNYIVFAGSNIENISGWFRRYISEATQQILVAFLKFSTGSSSIDFSLSSKVTVTFQNDGQNPKKLPISHTCWKQIVVPKYKTYDIMKKLLTAAFVYCSEGFGFG